MKMKNRPSFISQLSVGRGAQRLSQSYIPKYSSPKAIPAETVLVVKMKFSNVFSTSLCIVACHSTCFMCWSVSLNRPRRAATKKFLLYY